MRRRVPVDLTKLSDQTAPVCPSCLGPITRVESRQHTDVWYCSACDVNHELTRDRCILGSFRKVNDQVIFLQKGDGNVREY